MKSTLFRNLFYMVVITALLSGCSGRKRLSRDDQADLHYQAGIGYINQGEPQKAVEQLKIAHEHSKTNPQIIHALGLAYFQLGVPETALEWILKAASILPDDPEIQNNLASVYLRLNQYDKGIFHSTKAVSNPDYRTPAAAYFNRGVCKVHKGDIDGAETDFRSAIRHEPMYDMPRIELGRILIRKNQYDEAIRLLSSAVNVNTNNPESYLLRGQAFWYRGYVSRAETDFRKILEMQNVPSAIVEQAHDWLDRLR